MSSSTRTNTPSSSGTNTRTKTEAKTITILGFGSLLSENSSRTTFPDLQNFRLGRVPNYRRVFAHPASIFFQRGIANLETKEISSLSAEPCPDAAFVCSVFEVPNEDMMKYGVPSEAFLEREEEFGIISTNFFEADGTESTGVLCIRSTDDAYVQRWGLLRFEQQYKKYGVETIWGWGEDSGLRPCATYLRHCVLAAERMGEKCYNSFLDDTYLVDRKTTVREYLRENPQVMTTMPPPELQARYGG